MNEYFKTEQSVELFKNSRVSKFLDVFNSKFVINNVKNDLLQRTWVERDEDQTKRVHYSWEINMNFVIERNFVLSYQTLVVVHSTTSEDDARHVVN